MYLGCRHDNVGHRLSLLQRRQCSLVEGAVAARAGAHSRALKAALSLFLQAEGHCLLSTDTTMIGPRWRSKMCQAGRQDVLLPALTAVYLGRTAEEINTPTCRFAASIANDDTMTPGGSGCFGTWALKAGIAGG
jgi:hypothetical protein